MRRRPAARLSTIAALAALAAVTAAAQTQPAPRFRSGAEVIAIDVTVIDRQGVPVADLTSDDFTVTVEGRPRAIQSTQFLKSEKAPRAPRADESSNTESASGRLLLIVTDDATLRTSSKAVVESARGLLEHLGPGDLVGVAHVPDGGGVPFTTDHARVIAELARVRPAAPNVVRADASVYISEALDFDMSRRLQWPAAVSRECGSEADTPVWRLCVMNLEQTARQLLIDERDRTNATLRALERLMKSLEPTGLPVTLVLISESLVIAGEPAALVGLAEAGAAARVSLHVVQPAPAASEMTARGFSADPMGDAALRSEGLEQMAARVRGEFHRVVSTGANTFDQIGRELTGYYLLGIEPAPEDRQQPRRRVDVKVRRPGLTVRARSMFALNQPVNDAPTDTTARLRQLLEEAIPARGLPLRVTARTVSSGGNRNRVLIAAEIGEPTDQQARFHVGLIAVDASGAVKARAAAATLLSPARKDRQSPSLFTTSIELEPGDYSLRLAAVDEGGRSGSVHHLVHAKMREWPRGLRTSDLIVANEPAPGEFPPFNASAIVDTIDVAAVIEVLHENAAALNQAEVRFELDGTAVPASAEPAEARGSEQVRTFASLLTLSKTGEHRLRAVVKTPGADAIAIERAFTYEPAEVDAIDPVMRGYIEQLERRLPVSPSLAAFVAQAKRGQFTAAPDAEQRGDADLAMVTFVGGLAAMRDGKPALARVLFQQTLRKAPAFEGAAFYLAQIK